MFEVQPNNSRNKLDALCALSGCFDFACRKRLTNTVDIICINFAQFKQQNDSNLPVLLDKMQINMKQFPANRVLPLRSLCEMQIR